jgi:hypothetical protein
MEIVFKIKHWQIFGTFVLLAFIQSMSQDVNPIAGAVAYIFLISVIIGWIVLLGYGLARRQKDLELIQFKTFLWTAILLVLVTSGLRLLISTGKIQMDSGQNMTQTILFSVYFITSLTIIFTYPAKTLKRLETKKEIDINDYFGDIFRLLFWPIGIWSIQPRINKLKDIKVD